VKAASNAGTLKRLLSTELLAGGHKTGHLLLGQLNLATAEGRKVDVGDLVLLGGLGRHDCGVVRVVFGEGIERCKEGQKRTIGRNGGVMYAASEIFQQQNCRCSQSAHFGPR
jgi:hypothetical protein